MNLIEQINEQKIVIRRSTDNKVAKIDLKYGYEGMRVGDEVEVERTSDGGILLSKVDKTLFFEESKTESILKQDPSVKDVAVSESSVKQASSVSIEEKANLVVDEDKKSEAKSDKLKVSRSNVLSYILVFAIVFAISMLTIPQIQNYFSDDQKAYKLFMEYMRSEYDAEGLADFRLDKKDVLIVDMRKNSLHFDADYVIQYYSDWYESSDYCYIYFDKPVSEQCD